MSTYDPNEKLWHGHRRPTVLNPEASLGQVFLDVLERARDKVLQIDADTGSRLTGGELRRRIVRVAQNLTRLGFGTGDRVSLACGNSENVVSVFAGCLTIGLAVNPLAPIFKKEDYVHMMRQTQSRLIFCDESNRQLVEEAAKEAINQEVLIFVFGTESKTTRSVEELLQPTGDDEDQYEAQYLGDSNKLVALIMCSSGTTGLPKGVCLSHAHLIEGDTLSAKLNAGPVFTYSLLYWVTGVVTMLTSFFCSRPRIITSKPFDPDTLLAMIEEHRIELLFTPPSFVVATLAHPRIAEADLRSVKLWHIGGAMAPPEIIQKLQSRLPNGITQSAYGSSEIIAITYLDAVYGDKSVGPLASHLECRVVGENGDLLGPDEIGELLFRKKRMFLGYLNNDEATKQAMTSDGFLRSGDLGYFDRDGNLFLKDRIKDIIKYKGYQISPADLEDIVQRIDGVKMVCVVGIPSEDKTNDLPMALVERIPGATVTEAEIVQTVNDQVSDFKQLRGGVHFVDSFPLTVTGKILRRAVLKMALELPRV